jgi:hypothetical protein
MVFMYMCKARVGRLQLWCVIVSAQFGVNERPGALLPRPSLLVWDSFRGHLGDDTKRILTEMKTDMTVIPGGLMSV